MNEECYAERLEGLREREHRVREHKPARALTELGNNRVKLVLRLQVADRVPQRGGYWNTARLSIDPETRTYVSSPHEFLHPYVEAKYYMEVYIQKFERVFGVSIG